MINHCDRRITLIRVVPELNVWEGRTAVQLNLHTLWGSCRPIEIFPADGCFLDRLLLLDFNLFHPGSKGKQKMGEGNKQFDVN
jgi:hypothetical protein